MKYNNILNFQKEPHTFDFSHLNSSFVVAETCLNSYFSFITRAIRGPKTNWKKVILSAITLYHKIPEIMCTQKNDNKDLPCCLIHLCKNSEYINEYINSSFKIKKKINVFFLSTMFDFEANLMPLSENLTEFMCTAIRNGYIEYLIRYEDLYEIVFFYCACANDSTYFCTNLVVN